MRTFLSTHFSNQTTCRVSGKSTLNAVRRVWRWHIYAQCNRYRARNVKRDLSRLSKINHPKRDLTKYICLWLLVKTSYFTRDLFLCKKQKQLRVCVYRCLRIIKLTILAQARISSLCSLIPHQRLFRRVRKITKGFTTSFRRSAWKNSTPTGRILIKFHISVIL